MHQTSWLECMDSLKEKHKDIAKLIGNQKTAYIDIPTHFNVGDLLIYKGTDKFFSDYNINIVYEAGTLAIDFKKLEEADVILFHGGGNFGDLYPLHQKLREKVIKDFSHKRIICLPQSIHYDSQDALIKSSVLFKSHPDFHFFVRDDKSFEIANQFSNNVYKMPDMAHSLHPLVDQLEVGPSNIVPPKILNLIRVDKESNGGNKSLNKVGFDWVNIITPTDYFIQTMYFKMIKLKYLRPRAHKMWSKLSDAIIFRSIQYFSSHTLVHTDRLHGLILSCLLGKEIFLKDNSYGKNTNYYKAWLFEYPYIEVSPSE